MSDQEKEYSFLNMWFAFIKRNETKVYEEEPINPKKKKLLRKNLNIIYYFTTKYKKY
jgi:hypothetical protein